MSDYAELAMLVDWIHRIVIGIWIVGFVFLASRYPRLRLGHAVFGLLLAAIQIAAGTKCPLTVLADHLRDLADPGSVDRSVYTPFITRDIYGLAGITVPKWIIDTIAGLGTGWMVWTLYKLKWRRKK